MQEGGSARESGSSRASHGSQPTYSKCVLRSVPVLFPHNMRTAGSIPLGLAPDALWPSSLPGTTPVPSAG